MRRTSNTGKLVDFLWFPLLPANSPAMWNMAHIGIGALWKASKLGLKLMNQPTGSETVVLGAAERGAHSQSDEYACWLSISIR